MSRAYGLPETLAMLRKAVEEYGEDWVDPHARSSNCSYAYPYAGGVRHCIAGHVFKQASLEPEELEGQNARNVAYESGLFTNEAAMLLGDVQVLQDEGDSWGDAVRKVSSPAWPVGQLAF